MSVLKRKPLQETIQTIEYTHSDVLLISDGSTLALPTGSLMVEISAGSAWISAGNRDIVAQAGERVELEDSPHRRLISASHPSATVVFRVVKR